MQACAGTACVTLGNLTGQKSTGHLLLTDFMRFSGHLSAK